jgi:phosphomannomutase
MALLLDRLAETGLSVSALAAKLPRYVRRASTLPFEHGRLGQLMQDLEEEFPSACADRTDGLKLIVDQGWLHVRASNTEPIMRISVEARSEPESDALMERVLARLS